MYGCTINIKIKLRKKTPPSRQMTWSNGLEKITLVFAANHKR